MLGLDFRGMNGSDGKTTTCANLGIGLASEGKKVLLIDCDLPSICSDLKNRGVSDIFIAYHDNLKGLGEAINAVFPRTQQQLCIVHQIRNSTKFVYYRP